MTYARLPRQSLRAYRGGQGALLRPGELDAGEKLVERLAVHPRLGIPVPGGTNLMRRRSWSVF
ncbi:hypothetical protein ACIRRH_42210 [Kitasatospora sp. NPDC101235]|uniref:hypothetical protein n=1 Tax=Kitasatospora sp. NPDC101235 TaxID=3364101 RepID=UPI0038172EFB